MLTCIKKLGQNPCIAQCMLKHSDFENPCVGRLGLAVMTADRRQQIRQYETLSLNSSGFDHFGLSLVDVAQAPASKPAYFLPAHLKEVISPYFPCCS
jgi:hypothetical protein